MTLWYRLILSVSDKRREVFLRWLHRWLAISWNDCDIGIIHFRANRHTVVKCGLEPQNDVNLAAGDQIKITFDAIADMRFEREDNGRHPKET